MIRALYGVSSAGSAEFWHCLFYHHLKKLNDKSRERDISGELFMAGFLSKLGTVQVSSNTMCLTNFVAAAAIDAQNDIEEERKYKDNKYRYAANINELIGVLKDRLVLALTQDSADKQVAMIQSIVGEIQRYVVPIRPERSTPRRASPRKSKFHHNLKANC